MKFEWDERKNHANVEKHGLDFADAHKVFKAPMLVKLDEREDYGEYRWIGIGLMDMRVVVIVFTEPKENTSRVVSFRKATTDERKRYEQAYKDEFGTL
jgi:uncharacterized DUF497 family protein